MPVRLQILTTFQKGGGQMLSNYGYEDGSGNYYITIDTDKCSECGEKPCLQACPEGIFQTELDDYDDEVVIVREEARNRLRQTCAACKSRDRMASGDYVLPCLKACPEGALKHTW
jgi:ferredoxin